MSALDLIISGVAMGLRLLLWLLLWLGPGCGLAWVGYHLLSLRMRRQERARFFLDLAETGMVAGQTLENTIMSVANTRDGSMGVRFHLLAAYLEKGLTLPEAMAKVPRLLPAQMSEMLRAGIRIGDLNKVLPACRQLCRDAVSQTRGAINYMMVLAFVGFPLNLIILAIVEFSVIPQMVSVCMGMDVPSTLPFWWLVDHKILLLGLQGLLVLTVWLTALLYIAGPRLIWWRRLTPSAHRLILALPWRRKRLQRDFSAMLATLLDAGIPEAEAVTLAADCTGNLIFQRRAGAALNALRQGMKLPEAIALVDDTGELHWRLTNALRGGGDFFKAVRGWTESLDAKAYQLEQATAQIVTTGMVLANGAIVGVIVVSIFSVIAGILNEAVLW